GLQLDARRAEQFADIFPRSIDIFEQPVFRADLFDKPDSFADKLHALLRIRLRSLALPRGELCYRRELRAGRRYRHGLHFSAPCRSIRPPHVTEMQAIRITD